MDDHAIKRYSLEEGVYVSSSARIKFADFEKSYLSARKKEKRVLSIDEIRLLPNAPADSADRGLWEIRKKNICRFLKHLDKKKQVLNILDVGCGNGFFTHLMRLKNNRVTGVDVNLFELQQAAKAFNGSGISWYYADMMAEEIPGGKFDVITFCCSFQYFKDPAGVLDRCKSMLAENGEIHIIDSPFYTPETQRIARQNSQIHYKNLEAESMVDFYHHNTYAVLEKYNFSFKYKPQRLLLKFLRDSPFPWIIIT